MEQKDKVAIIHKIQYLRVLSFGSYVGFSGLLLLMPFRALAQLLVYPVVPILIAMYIAGVRLRKFRIISASWLLLGTTFVLSWIFATPFVSYLTVFLWTILLIAAYEVTRFANTVDPLARVIPSLDERTAGRFSKVMSRHDLVTMLLISFSLFSSIVIVNLSVGVLIPTLPVLGVALFGLLAILLIAAMTVRKSLKY